jgi:hypothetical protein
MLTKIIRSGLNGALQGGMFGLLCAAVAYRLWPVYKTFTPQFKVFIQTGFILGYGSFRADRDLLRYERKVRYEVALEQERRLYEAAEKGIYVNR